MKHILVIDDDISIGTMLEELLTREGYQVSHAYSGTEALLVLKDLKPNLILLDLMLPGLNGEELLPKIAEIPTIILSAKVDIDHKVDLLLHGAVDYITKPFDTRELLARICVQLRNASSFGTSPTITYDDITIHTDSHTVIVCKETVKLTKTEYAILKLLIQNNTMVMTKSMLLDRISEDTPDCMESSLKVHISNLRRKLKAVSGKDYIESIWGIGFKMKPEEILTIS